MQHPDRRDFLKGTLAGLILLATSGVYTNYEDLLDQCTIGLAACQEMSKSADPSEIRLAYRAVGQYMQILTAIAHNSARLRDQALNLAGHTALLRTILFSENRVTASGTQAT